MMNKNKIDCPTCLISTFCKDRRLAYNLVKLASYFHTRDPLALSLTVDYVKEVRRTWYEVNDVQLLLNDKAFHIDTVCQTVTGKSGTTVPTMWQYLPKEAGSINRPVVFIYRNKQDLEDIL
jgi:NAD(P)H-nitrite reductase large subunit